MNLRLVTNILGVLSIIIAAAMLPSLGIAIFDEATPEISRRAIFAFGVSIAFIAGFGFILQYLTSNSSQDNLTPSEGFAIAAVGWLLMAALGAMPMYLCRDNTPTYQLSSPDAPGSSPSPRFTYADAYFESMSGFSTTGSSVFGTSRADGGNGVIEALPRSFLFWRSLTHWLGGMGIVVLCLAILPSLRAGGYQMFRAEVPGPTAERLQPRIRETAAILWGVYLLLSVAEAVLLRLGGMPTFDSLCHTFGTMATGGFSTKDASIGHYAMVGHPSALYFELVIDFFMFLAGCNFLLHYQALHGNPLEYRKDAEFRFYLWGTLIVTFVIASILYIAGADKADTFGGSLRISIFQVLSMTTTTGYGTADFNLWPGACRALMVLLMFFGGCAGSTGGGLKQVRIMVAAKYCYRELLRLLRPKMVNRIRIGSATLEERLVASIIGLVVLYALIFAVATVLMLICLGDVQQGPNGPLGADSTLVTAATSVVATLNNIGPGLSAVGSTANFGWIPVSGKILLSFFMAMGRLEVYSVLVVLLPLAWRK